MIHRSMLRIFAFTGAALLSLPGPGFAQSPASLQSQMEALSAKAKPGRFGIAVIDLATGRHWSVDGDQRFPMMSDFKAPIAAAILSRVDAGTLSLTRMVTLEPPQYVPGSAVPSIGARLARGRLIVSVAQLLAAAVSQSDNTSCDALIRLLGGPEQVTAYLRSKGIPATTITAGEAGNAAIFEHLHGGKPPAGETVTEREQRYGAGYRAFLADPPNQTTPDAAALFLEKLDKGQLLSAKSTRYLLGLMEAQTIPLRLRAGLPPGYRFADKTGTTGTVHGRTAAFNDTGIVTAPDGHTAIITALLSDSDASFPERNALFATLMRDVVADVLAPHP